MSRRCLWISSKVSGDRKKTKYSVNTLKYQVCCSVQIIESAFIAQDRHATGEYEPAVDESQDWNLISATETAGYTVVIVSRKHVTDDSDDLCITVRNIFPPVESCLWLNYLRFKYC